MELKDKVVVITGAASGLGLSLAKQMAEEGVELVLSSRTAEESENLCQILKCIAIPADVTQTKEMENLAQEALNKWGRIDIWINNAGVWIPYAPADIVSIEDYQKLMDVNFFGLMHGSFEATKIMKRQKGGTIVNVLSVRPLHPVAGSAAYCASKAAAIGFTKTLRLELAEENIPVIGVYPSGMKTHLFDVKMPIDYQNYMDPQDVAKHIIANLKNKQPEMDLLVSREILSQKNY